MNDSELIETTIAYVKETLKGAESGHDWFHIERVFNNTLLIAKEESVHILTCLLYTSPSPRDRTRSRMPSSA